MLSLENGNGDACDGGCAGVGIRVGAGASPEVEEEADLHRVDTDEGGAFLTGDGQEDHAPEAEADGQEDHTPEKVDEQGPVGAKA